ncbi:MAG: anthranilate synthase [Thermobacillus sp. ZCTH02-B1]|uniref:anthranilate synthase component I family protein n=1 Tax=Thermobacillus sp. ZCTH02-B1 TaxID=1858795 RepID=UPI000B5866FF|nr:anthranilate synthase component I family protein [Thermobacillus sp. ZCTH02-B1]OUM95513.1 MAG: anthranilate synthase [Thermobacillus sp. ZCTH02-B1]
MTETGVVTTLEQWRAWRRAGYNALPLLRRVPLGPGEDRPAEWSGAWAAADPHAILLESGKDGRYTYLGLRPSAVLRGKGCEAAAAETGGEAGPGEAVQRFTGKPLEVVRAWIAGRKGPAVPDGPKWTGGIAGLWSYDIVRSLERLPELAADDLGLPDYLFLRLDELWIIDHAERQLLLSRHVHVPDGTDDEGLAALYEEAVRHTDRMRGIWDGIAAAARSPEAVRRLAARRAATEADRLEIDIDALEGLIRPFSKEAYMNAVERIRDYIARGDVFQVNLSQRMSKASRVDPDALYEWLRLFNPSPYMGCLRCPDFRLVSASPELLVAMRGGRLTTRPIAGTRRRGRTPEEDRRMAEELLASEKERAEHIMLVDLERNDLGRISKYGTVRVKELMTIESYSHVMHLVSQVEGELQDGKDALDVIGAVFPGGTITGAPKVRTMEILEELEPTRRGPYYGSLGWIDYSGDMEFNILIRTMVVRDGHVHIQAGGGVVIDSDPEREYKESLNKAKALWKAVQYAEREAEGELRRAAPVKEDRR